MKRMLFIGMLALLTAGFVRARPQPYRVVFDLTSRDTLEQKAVLRWCTKSAHRARMHRWR